MRADWQSFVPWTEQAAAERADASRRAESQPPINVAVAEWFDRDFGRVAAFARAHPKSVFGTAAGVLTFSLLGPAVLVMLLAYGGTTFLVARRTERPVAEVARKPFANSLWVVLVVVVTLTVIAGLTPWWAAWMIISCLTAAWWLEGRRNPVGLTTQLEVSWSDNADAERWGEAAVRQLADEWQQHVAKAVSLAYQQPISAPALKRWQAASMVDNMDVRREQQINELMHGKAPTSEWVAPTLSRVEVTLLGPKFIVQMRAGQTLDNYRKASGAIAVAYDVDGCRITQVSSNEAGVQLVTTDPLAAGVAPVSADTAATSDLTYVELGMLETGEVWRHPLSETSSVIAGVPGAGKSVMLNVVLSQLAARPDVQLALVDCKQGMEFGPWAPRAAAHSLSMDPATAVPVLTKLVEQMQLRMEWMRRNRIRRMQDYGFSTEHPMWVLMIDEVAELWGAGTDKATAVTLVDCVSKLVRLGRAAGYVVMVATQKPTADCLPTIIRDNCAGKIAFRCTTSQQVTAIMGESIADGQPSPTDFTNEQRGYAVVSTVAGVYSIARGRYIGDDTVEEIVRRTAHLTQPLGAEIFDTEEDEEPLPTTLDNRGRQSYAAHQLYLALLEDPSQLALPTDQLPDLTVEHLLDWLDRHEHDRADAVDLRSWVVVLQAEQARRAADLSHAREADWDARFAELNTSESSDASAAVRVTDQHLQELVGELLGGDTGPDEIAAPAAGAETIRALYASGEVGTRTANCLAGMTLADVAAMTATELRAIPGFGKKSLQEVQRLLRNHGLKLSH